MTHRTMKDQIPTVQIRVPSRRDAGGDTRVPPYGEPVTLGVPFPRGAAHDGLDWCITDEANRSRRAQMRALDRWPDGSIRWGLVDTRVDAVKTSDSGFGLGLSPGTDADTAPQLSVTEADDRVVVETGAARFIVRRGGRMPFDSVEIGGKTAVAEPSGLVLEDASGTCSEISIDTVRVEDAGPLRARVRAEGKVLRSSHAELVVIIRIDLYAGLPTAHLLVTIRNPHRAHHRDGFWDLGDPGSVLIRDLSLVFALPAHGKTVAVRCSPEKGAPWADFSAPFELYQDSSGGEQWRSSNHINRNRTIPTTFRGYRLQSGNLTSTGLRATPVIAVTDGVGVLNAAVPHFWQNFPVAVEVQDASLILRLFPKQFSDVHELQGGEQKTFECYVSFGRDGAVADTLEWCRSPTIACTDPTWVISTGVVPFFERLSPDHVELIDEAIKDPHSFDAKREVIDEYGWRHFGEIYGDHETVRQTGPQPLVSHYNNQYDPIAGFAYQFLRTADPRWRTMMVELAAHVMDIDVYHTVEDKWAYNHGMFWHTYHYGDADTATHRTYPRAARGRVHGGGPSADHNYTTGLMLYYFLTGNEAARQSVIDSAQFVIDMDDGRKTVYQWLDRGDTGWAARSAGYYGPGRGPANSLNALIDGYRLSGDARFIAKGEQLLRRVIHPKDVIADHRLENPEERWFYTMFLQSLGKYLQFKAERGELDDAYAYGRESLLHYARWMVENEYPYLQKPEKLEFPTETWAAQDIRKSDVFLFAAIHAVEHERERFIERARFFYDYSVSTLAGMPTRTFARPIVILLTSGFLFGWFTRNPGAAAPMPQSPGEFGAPSHFVPQKERAMRKAVVIAATGAIAALLAAAATWF